MRCRSGYEYYVGSVFIRYHVATKTNEMRLLDYPGWKELSYYGAARPWYAKWVSKSEFDKRWERLLHYMEKGSNG